MSPVGEAICCIEATLAGTGHVGSRLSARGVAKSLFITVFCVAALSANSVETGAVTEVRLGPRLGGEDPLNPQRARQRDLPVDLKARGCAPPLVRVGLSSPYASMPASSWSGLGTNEARLGQRRGSVIEDSRKKFSQRTSLCCSRR